MGDYFIGLVQSGAERHAAEQLSFWAPELDVYFPTIAAIRKPRHASAPRVMLIPAFPGYVFMSAVAEAYVAVERSSLCRAVLRLEADTAVLPQAEIDTLRRCESEWHKSPIKLRGRLVPGQIVRITQGLLTGYLGTILDASATVAHVSINSPNRCSAKVSLAVSDVKPEPIAETAQNSYVNGEPLTYRKGFLRAAGT